MISFEEFWVILDKNSRTEISKEGQATLLSPEEIKRFYDEISEAYDDYYRYEPELTGPMPPFSEIVAKIKPVKTPFLDMIRGRKGKK